MKKKHRRRLDRYIAECFDLCAQFGKWASKENWTHKLHSKRMSEKKYDGVYRVPVVELTKGKVHVMVEGDGADICGIDGGSFTFYRMPQCGNRWRLLQDKGVWTLVNIDEHPSERKELLLDEDNFMFVLRLLNAPWPDVIVGDKMYRDEAFYPPPSMEKVSAGADELAGI